MYLNNFELEFSDLPREFNPSFRLTIILPFSRTTPETKILWANDKVTSFRVIIALTVRYRNKSAGLLLPKKEVLLIKLIILPLVVTNKT